ncbi:MAG: hypothetical protein ACLP51_13655 [Syntrophobacteraceae bacterium]
MTTQKRDQLFHVRIILFMGGPSCQIPPSGKLCLLKGGNPQPSLFTLILSLLPAPATVFLPLLIAVSIAASGCRFSSPFGEAKLLRGTILSKKELQV